MAHDITAKQIIEKTISKLEKDSIIPFLSLSPILVIIHTSEMPSGEQSYLKSLKKTAEKYGVKILDEVADSPFMVIECIKKAKFNYSVQGIMIISDYGNITRTLYDAIPLRLDIDGLSSYSLGKLLDNPSVIAYRQAPCTAVACLKIMQEISCETNTPLAGKRAAIISRSIRVGRPLAELLLQQDMSVSVFHSKACNFNIYDYDYFISAIGQPHYWDKDSLSVPSYASTHYIDAGISINEEGKVCGDINPDILKEASTWYPCYLTPVPGGVGKVTTTVIFAKLFHNAAEYFVNSSGDNLTSIFTDKHDFEIKLPENVRPL